MKIKLVTRKEWREALKANPALKPDIRQGPWPVGLHGDMKVVPYNVELTNPHRKESNP